MRKNIILLPAALLVIALAVPLFAEGDAELPKIAVYVTGGNNANENDALGSQLLSAIIRSGRYTAIERTDVFLAEIDREHVRQRSGAIDDAQISRLGMQAGVQYVCVAVITQAFDSYQVSARILDVETAKVVTAAATDSRRLRTMNDLNRLAAKVVEGMFDDGKPGRRVKFGGRLAYNNSFVPGVVVDVTSYDEDAGLTVEYYDGRPGFGHGFGVGGVVLFGVWGDFGVSLGADIVYRAPVVSEVSVASEFAVGVPVLVRWDVMGGPLYVEAGAQVDIPFGSAVRYEWDSKSEPVGNRASVDVGIAVGAGYYVTKNIAADIRAVIGLTPFDSQNGYLLNQICVGVSYLY